ncbi:PAS domain-containing protein [Granulicella pectinivorans]|jgi:nitrogen fixation/metabolism regulation signal transduction histidine kinase|uniref:histidine kinase n=2 Tax=Granulicella pectinivorans TaxID=474950 RepID=A0A1I6MXX9_9BACT|nr:PAS domain-containing protein [Granulicella pectinivorans]
MALGPKGKRLSFELRLRQKLWGMGVPALVLAGYLLWDEGWFAVLVGVCCVAMGWALVVSLVMESVVKPMQTLSNVIAGLREDDFSFRARGGRRNDAVGDLAIEVNALAAMLQMQRGSALEAVALAERVMSAMQTPVLAFDGVGRVQMMNPAAERVFGLELGAVMGVPGAAVGLDGLLVQKEEEPVSLGGAEAGSRWVVKRTGFRMQGIPHVLVVLSEVSSALREEERNAWRRLVRVMGHEINNSLTPIKSIAGSLRMRLPKEGADDLARGLGVIENRAESLNRFLQAYRQLSGLPKPRLGRVPVGLLVERVVSLERGVTVEVVRGEAELSVWIDEDQVQQALINLVKNAVEAAMGPDTDSKPMVQVGWGRDKGEVAIWVLDNGPGITNPDNLFVPFYTTKPEGTGIGLALALQIAEAHQGTVRLTNRTDGIGCRAEIRLPV